jgi:predicted dehydrogenase
MKIRVGIIGCGGIAFSKHMPGLAKLENVEIAAFQNRTRAKAEKALTQFGCGDAQVYDSYQELLDDPGIDAVHICTANATHAQISIAALEKGKHVMCEKPMALNAGEARAMRDAALRSGKKLSVSYQSRFRDDAVYLKNRIREGELGHIYYARAHALRRRAVPTWGSFNSMSDQGGGSLIDIGTHALDLTLWLMDNYEPRTVLGSSYNELSREDITANAFGPVPAGSLEVEESAFGFITMKNGATVILESSWALNTLTPGEAKTSLHGTKAGADMLDGLRINGEKDGQLYTLKPELYPDGMDYCDSSRIVPPGDREMAEWIRALTEDREPPVTAEQALVVSEILDALYESARTGAAVSFP